MVGTRAKITNFGMSKLATDNPHMSLYPCNLLYMSPEALDKVKSYTDKLDIFSFGVIVVQILTRQFPNPTNRFRTCCDPENEEEEEHDEDVKENEEVEEDKVRRLLLETEQRQAHLQLIPDTHSLKLLAIQCLRKKERSRLTVLQLSKKLSELNEAPQYTEIMRQAQTRGGSETRLNCHSKEMGIRVPAIEKNSLISNSSCYFGAREF